MVTASVTGQPRVVSGVNILRGGNEVTGCMQKVSATLWSLLGSTGGAGWGQSPGETMATWGIQGRPRQAQEGIDPETDATLCFEGTDSPPLTPGGAARERSRCFGIGDGVERNAGRESDGDEPVESGGEGKTLKGRTP